MRNKSGGMSVSLTSPDEQVVGGGATGLLVAVSPVQIVVGSFLAGNQHEQSRKQKIEFAITATPTTTIPISSGAMEETWWTTNFSYPENKFLIFFRGDNWSSLPPESRKKPTDINVTLPG
ncbi:hypothetical protein Vadar_026671 [Vaccinium darrowii]|uniref:Uncharacterized protein n=1 Tax=Vaccinium darrowii TaxID=229202 RepID=A0ACB7YQ98_9ERIC|nr:hypothetical protein Vadar_026671 [Vaccinium darrowii]